VPIEPGAPCNGVPGICDDLHACVECTQGGHCGSGVCREGICRPSTCENQFQDLPDEIGEDCGATCGGCPDGTTGCDDGVTGECAGRCVAGTCEGCVFDGDCGVGRYCDSGTCTRQRVAGAPCSLDIDDECLGTCSFDLVCCDSICSNQVDSCLAEETGRPTGECALIIPTFGDFAACGP
jgi:hypothetical protein